MALVASAATLDGAFDSIPVMHVESSLSIDRLLTSWPAIYGMCLLQSEELHWHMR